jgi:flagellar biosynthesis/type III secretory pathway M-ring protein FliF/YscJ
MADLNNLPRIELNPALKELLEQNNTATQSNSYLWIIIIGVVVAVLILVVLFFIIQVIIKKRALPPEFKSLLEKGNASLKNKDLQAARSIYYQMKAISEDSNSSRLKNLTLDFYRRVLKLMNSN